MKAQMFIMDLIFTGAIFAMLFFMIALTVNNTVNQHGYEFERSRASLLVEQLASVITLTPGYPLNWNQTSVVYPGISYSPNQLDQSKYDQLVDFNYSLIDIEDRNVSLILEQVSSSGYTPVNCSKFLIEKYGNCTYTTEVKTSRLLYKDGEVYRLWVVVE